MKDNRIVVDLSKVQWARFGYRNQHGNWRDVLPLSPTAYNQPFKQNDRVFGEEESSMIDYAIANKLLDIWIPELRLKVTANTWLTYTGDKAISLWKAFRAKQFNK